MATSSRKRAASSPLRQESDKKPRLGLTDDEISALEGWMAFSRACADKLSAADVTSNLLAMTLQQIAIVVTLNGCASRVDKGWFDLQEGERRIKELPHDEQEDLKSAWVEARVTGGGTLAWGTLAGHVLLRSYTQDREDQEATEKSWEQPFRGDAAQGLWNHIEAHFTSATHNEYAHYAAIVQSSGMGKSRTVDELGREHFTIPLVLREANSTGYPPDDHSVSGYLTGARSKDEAYNLASAFFEELFIHTAEVVSTFDQSLDYYGIAREFRKRMTEGQTMTKHNDFRQSFYKLVVARARSDKPGAIKREGYPPSDELVKLVESLRFPEGKGKMRQKTIPLVVLAFDEADTLTARHQPSSCEAWNLLDEIREALRMLQWLPLFSLFIGTTSNVSQTVSVKPLDFSARIIEKRLDVVEPYTDIGFDPLAVVISLDGSWDLERLTDIAQMSSQGRPLIASRYQQGSDDVKKEIVQFAAAKLLNDDHSIHSIEKLSNEQALACLAQRFPIEFDSTNPVARDMERKQVKGHMRVCLNIDATSGTMTTTSSSDPTLSEAAYFVMQKPSFNAPDALKSVMEGFLKSDHGELVVLLLLILARDATVGPADEFGEPLSQQRWFSLSKFLCGQVFQKQTEATSLMTRDSILAMERLREDFPNAQVHFNHFVRIQECEAIDLTSLLLLKGRGAGVLCANNQTGIDAIITFLANGTKLIGENAGLILLQVNNDDKYTTTPQQRLFDLMDPYELDILDEHGAAVPVIKVVFALAATTPGLNIVRHAPSADYDAVVYEIWCAGMSPDILVPIDSQHVGIWESLLQASYGWKRVYKTPSTVMSDLRRSAVPGAAVDPGHYSRWARRD